MNIEYEVPGSRRMGYLARPVSNEIAGGVLVLHGGGGIGEHAKQRADLLSSMGYVAFVPDLFGHPVDGVEHAKRITAQLTEDWAELRARCNLALDILRGQSGVNSRRIAAIGFCFGGQAALELGRSGAEVRAIVGFHSQLRTCRPEDSVNIKGSVLVCLGDRDCFVSCEEREEFMENMTRCHVDCQLLLFSGVAHSFTDRFAEASGVPGLKYDARADRRAWTAMTELLSEVLGPKYEQGGNLVRHGQA
jgi:dienelactone hydrolase